ncbi:MAG: hypothetical protein M3094_07585, partial [Actinomycetia bacterium]|nr:hypothetical protein [Actinomycetes bacterium]
VSLGRVQDALDTTREAVGGVEELSKFVDLALGFYGLRTTSDDGGRTFRIEGHHPDLDDLVGDGASRYTFDPAVGMGDPDLDIIDLSHRLVRRLVDLTTERANLPDCVGRIAAIHTGVVDSVVGLCHILTRYVAQGDPPVLLEELVPVAIPVYGDGSVPDVGELSDPPPGPGSRTTDEIADDSRALLDRSDLTDQISIVLEERRAAIADTHADLEAPWSRGLENVDIASWDLTAVTILYPVQERL